MKWALGGALLLAIVLCLLPFASAAYSGQVTTHVLASPFYQVSGVANNNTTRTITFNPPDNARAVTSAIITVEVWMSPTVTFSLYVNGRSCNNQNYTISTTYSGAGNARLHFDCTNIITTSGSYAVTLRATSPYGASTVWADIAYENNPSRDILVSGTDYEPGDNAKIFTTIIDATAQPVDNATCIVKAYYPNSSVFVPFTSMTLLAEGIYYYDFDAPSTIGVYPVEVRCTYSIQTKNFNATTGHRFLGAGAGPISNTHAVDGSNWGENENLGDNRLVANEFNYTLVNTIGLTIENVNINFTGRRVQQGLDPASDPIKFWLFNFKTSKYVLAGSDFSYFAVDTKKTYSITINATDYISNATNGLIRIYVNDTVATAGGDLASTDMEIDQLQVYVSGRLTNQSVTTIAGGGELNIRNRTGSIINATANVNVSAIAAAVWAFPVRNLSFYERENLTLLGQYVWNETTRNLTFYPNVNFTVNESNIASTIWAYSQNGSATTFELLYNASGQTMNITGDANVAIGFSPAAIIFVIWAILLILGFVVLSRTRIILMIAGAFTILLPFLVGLDGGVLVYSLVVVMGAVILLISVIV